MTTEQLTAQFQFIDDALNRAFETNNTSEIENYLADEWRLLEPDLGMIPKEQFLTLIEKGNIVHTAMRKKVRHVQMQGTIAIVFSRGPKTCFLNTQEFHADYWVTNTYKKDNDQWICILTHESPVRE